MSDLEFVQMRLGEAAAQVPADAASPRVRRNVVGWLRAVRRWRPTS